MPLALSTPIRLSVGNLKPKVDLCEGEMAVTENLMPTSDEFRPLVLRVLSDGQARNFRELCALTADLAGLTEEGRAEQLPSGQSRYLNRINWACSALFQANLVSRPKRGVYEITDDGRTVDARGLDTYSEKDMLEWPAWQAYQQEVADRKKASAVTGNEALVELTEMEDRDPVETVEDLVSSFNAEVETKLRGRLQDSTPEFLKMRSSSCFGRWDTAVHMGATAYGQVR